MSSVSRDAAASSYHETLDRLFRAVKNPSRHYVKLESSKDADPIATVFMQRKAFFQEVFARSSLGNAKVIHVAGTKGKGSTIEYISSAIRSTGARVGIFTSPHLHTARERIKVGEELISRADIVRLGDEALQRTGDFDWVVFFDLFLYIALRYFGEQAVDYIVMEVGIGGRYDSTNFLDSSCLSVITSISLDHIAILGDTVEEIAAQKAGIIKRNGVAFVSSTQQSSVLDVFRKECAKNNATLNEIPVTASDLSDIASLDISYATQVQNVCVSLAVLRYLGIRPDGMKSFYWPCRYEKFVCNSSHIIIDGCHNLDSVHQFLRGVKELYPNDAIVSLVGIGAEKCVQDMVHKILEDSDVVFMVQSKHFRSMTEAELCEFVSSDKRGKVMNYTERIRERQVTGTIAERLLWCLDSNNAEKIRLRIGGGRGAQSSVVLAIFGSLFAAAEARECIYDVSPDLFAPTDWVTCRD